MDYAVRHYQITSQLERDSNTAAPRAHAEVRWNTLIS